MVDLSKFAVGGATRPDSFSGMQPQFQSALASLFASAPDNIRAQLQVKSGYRSPERQAQLWQEALAKYGSADAARKWVAPPGNSQHNHGNAADLGYLSPEALQWAHQNAGQFGLAFPLKNEDWHVELAGARGSQAAAPTMANAQNKTFDPVGDVMAAAQPQAATPMMPGAPAVAAPAQFGLGDLAALFAGQQQDVQQRQADQKQAELTRRQALFAPDSVAGLYGAA